MYEEVTCMVVNPEDNRIRKDGSLSVRVRIVIYHRKSEGSIKNFLLLYATDPYSAYFDLRKKWRDWPPALFRESIRSPFYQLSHKSSRVRVEKSGRALVLSIIGYHQSKLLYRSKALLY